MSSNAQKVPFVRSQNLFAERKVRDALQLLGKSLPASVVSVSGSIVTVNFEVNASPLTIPQVTVPIATSQYRREPTQVGDLGVVRASDVLIGNVSGLGGGTPDLSVPANLASLVWEPVANKNWSVTDDPNAYVIYGPNGVILRDSGKKSVLTLTQNGIVLSGQNQVQLKVGSVTVTLSPSGVDIEGTLTINGQLYSGHMHSGVQTGGADTGPVVP